MNFVSQNEFLIFLNTFKFFCGTLFFCGTFSGHTVFEKYQSYNCETDTSMIFNFKNVSRIRNGLFIFQCKKN